MLMQRASKKTVHGKGRAMFLSVSLAIQLQYFKLECEVPH